MPSGRSSFDPKKMTDSLANGIKGIIEMIDAIDRGDIDLPTVFIGDTNINMALVAQRLGFTIADNCRDAEGNIDKSLPMFTIVGKLQDIRTKVEEFRRQGRDARIMRRSQRLQPAGA